MKTLTLVAVPTGWILLGVPVATGLPVEPFVLLTLALGLVLPAVLLTRRDPDATVRSLLLDCVRLPRPLALLLPALVALPALTWLVARSVGAERTPGWNDLVGLVLAVVIVNLWEEMAWTGFVQRRAMARWGFLVGSLVTAALFVAVHLPLALADADSPADVALAVAALVVAGIGLRLLLGFTDRVGGGSLLTVAIVHASFNSAAVTVDAGSDWLRYAVTLAAGLVALAVATRSRTATREPQPEPVR